MSDKEEIQFIEPIQKRKRVSYFNRFFVYLNIVAASALGISYLSPYVSPENFWFLAFFGLAYPILLIINILFLFFWILRWKAPFLISFITIAAGISELKIFAQINLNPIPIELNESNDLIKTMSYNTRLFDLYNWSHNKQTRNKMFDLIKEEAPNIMCLQEFYVDDSKEFATLDTLLKLQDAKNHHVEYTKTLNKDHHWGIATFTSYPIVNKGVVDFIEKNNNICIYTDILIHKDTVRVYNMHLQSIHFRPSDYKFMEDLANDKGTEEIEHTKNIFKLLKRAYAKRAVQVDQINKHIENCIYPIILCGDFNDTPTSYTYHTLIEGLTDSFVESGNGLGRTYIGQFPSLRIDYIFHSNYFKSYDFQTIRQELSDHFPVCCYLKSNK